jgi:hypothetical protein
MIWIVAFHEDFMPEFQSFSDRVQDAIFARAGLLEREGPQLSRPFADTLAGSTYANMKELRVSADGGVWRVAFAFDPERRAILLVAGNKTGRDQRRFYKLLIATAEARYASHLHEIGTRKNR